MRYLILGGGPAGIAAAKTLRKEKPDAEIVVATDETDAPYLRPLLPDLILGDAGDDSILDPQGRDLAEKGVRWLTGHRAVRLDMGNRQVDFSDGTREGYDVLLVSTGGKPDVPTPLMKGIPAIRVFDSRKDALAIRERAALPGGAVVYGPGYLAIEACRALRGAKKEVVWVKPDLPKYGYPIAGELEASILDDVRNRGARILEGENIVHAWEKDAETTVVLTRGGEEIPCSLVVVATERVPSVGFLSGSGVMVGTGVLVDDFLRTSAPNVYAAGDCAEFANQPKGVGRINFGWRSAIRQGQLAGENMAGGNKRFGGNEGDYFWALFGFSLLDRAKK
ncbi:MAG: FAD-dependent oxidoreductase [Deltaproteobacteria bacterium]|nr:FAD-dependent oxidoreductase [Deltaproteobacteria bacterium]